MMLKLKQSLHKSQLVKSLLTNSLTSPQLPLTSVAAQYGMRQVNLQNQLIQQRMSFFSTVQEAQPSTGSQQVSFSQIAEKTPQRFDNNQPKKNQKRSKDDTSSRSYAEILANIAEYQNRIEKKQAKGMGLSKSIAAEVEENKFQNQQMYEIFIQKMDRLYKSHVRFNKKLHHNLKAQTLAGAYTSQPLKEILRTYNDMTTQGFSGELASRTLESIDRAIRARGFDQRVMMDYSQKELEESWRFQKVVEDLNFGLRADQFFSPHHMGETANLLAEVNYKDSNLINQYFEKIHALIKERKTGQKEHFELTTDHIIFGSYKNYLPRHYVFRGFENSEDFNNHLKILLQWKSSQDGYQTVPTVSNKVNQNKEVAELEAAMKSLIEASLEVREVQKDLQATIDNVRSQYFKMMEASDKYAFLQENDYIRYDMLELQERLVRGGYIDHEEALNYLTNEPFEKRMNRAAKVFYDYVVNFAPEVLSPQHDQFYEAALESLKTLGQQKPNVSKFLNEDHNLINLASLSEILYGLRKQSLLYRKDVQKKDYLNEFYHQYLEPEDKMGIIKESFKPHERNIIENKFVAMERVYLRPWATFRSHTKEILSYMKELAKKDSNSFQNQVRGLLAFASAGYDVPDIRRKLVRRSLETIGNQKLDPATVKGGLLGLAMSSTQDEESLKLAAKLAQQVQPNEYDFAEQLDVMWSLCALQQYDAPALKKLCEAFEVLEFERLAYEIKVEEFTKLMDIMNALKLESNGLTINNKSLQDIHTTQKASKLFFEEPQKLFDPFKKRVISALALGLSKSSIAHETIMEEELMNQHLADEIAINPQKYPYTPDMMMGYKGQKVAMFVLQEFDSTRDTHQPNGAQRFRMRLLQRAHNNDLVTASITVDEVINYDIEKMEVKLNQKFNFLSTLESRLDGNKKLEEQHDFSKLSNFGYKLVKAAIQFQEKQPRIDQVQKLDSFVKKLGQIFQMKQQADLKIDPTQRNSGYDQVRFQIMLLSIMYDRLAKETKQFIDSELPDGLSLKQLLLETAQSIKTQNDKPSEINELDHSWVGTRLSVELPSFNGDTGIQAQKAVEPEMLNQRFLWVESYFHYKDWKAAQEQVYDNFNLLEVPSVSADKTHSKPKYFFDKDSFRRRVPEGIFPLASHKREVLKPHHQYAEMDLARSKNNDELALFAKEPLKMMILKEFKKSESLKPVNDRIKMITNLQNIKQGLKADYSDRELLSTILLNLNFTENLIKEHLAKRDGTYSSNNNPLFLDRDPALFREFVRSTYDSKDRQDPYTHFYLQEAAKKQQRIEEYDKLNKEIDQHEHSMDEFKEAHHEKKMEKLQDKIDRVLLEYEMQNEDLFQLSAPLPSRVSINVNLSTLVKSEFVYDMEPELNDQGLSDQEYLNIQRCRAETKLIKMKILYKLHRDIELSENERKYLKVWVDDVTLNQDRNALNLRDSLVPSEPSRLSLRDMSEKDFYTLNTIPRVDIDRRQNHSKYALNDLVLELGHFLDEEAVNKVETQMLSERLRNEWGLSKDFKVVESRNKEISLVLNELEEMAYRTAGEITTQDMNYIKSMLSVARNKTTFDQSYFEQDMKSLEQFANQVNTYDDRIHLLEKWIRRKEEEIKERIVVAPQNLRKTDQELHQEYDKPLKLAREKLVSQFLATDEYGNPIKKDYKDLSSLELHRISENLAVRLYLFNYEYPAFLPQAVKAVIEHPNILRSDKDNLTTYCKVFELDWRGDQSVENKSQMLFQAPIYPYGQNFKSYGEINENVVQDKMRRACAPYVEPLATKVLQSAKSL